MTPDWSPQQQSALARVEQWFGAQNAPQIFPLALIELQGEIERGISRAETVASFAQNMADKS